MSQGLGLLPPFPREPGQGRGSGAGVSGSPGCQPGAELLVPRGCPEQAPAGEGTAPRVPMASGSWPGGLLPLGWGASPGPPQEPVQHRPSGLSAPSRVCPRCPSKLTGGQGPAPSTPLAVLRPRHLSGAGVSWVNSRGSGSGGRLRTRGSATRRGSRASPQPRSSDLLAPRWPGGGRGTA